MGFNAALTDLTLLGPKARGASWVIMFQPWRECKSFLRFRFHYTIFSPARSLQCTRQSLSNTQCHNCCVLSWMNACEWSYWCKAGLFYVFIVSLMWFVQLLSNKCCYFFLFYCRCGPVGVQACWAIMLYAKNGRELQSGSPERHHPEHQIIQLWAEISNFCTCRRLPGYMDAWMDGWMDRWMVEGWMDDR